MLNQHPQEEEEEGGEEEEERRITTTFLGENIRQETSTKKKGKFTKQQCRMFQGKKKKKKKTLTCKSRPVTRRHMLRSVCVCVCVGRVPSVACSRNPRHFPTDIGATRAIIPICDGGQNSGCSVRVFFFHYSNTCPGVRTTCH